MPRYGKSIYTGRIEIRLTAAQRALYERCAQVEGHRAAYKSDAPGVGAWMRQVCDDAAARLFPAQADLSGSEAHEARQENKARGCPRWMYHVPGVWCPGCDTVIDG